MLAGLRLPGYERYPTHCWVPHAPRSARQLYGLEPPPPLSAAVLECLPPGHRMHVSVAHHPATTVCLEFVPEMAMWTFMQQVRPPCSCTFLCLLQMLSKAGRRQTSCAAKPSPYPLLRPQGGELLLDGCQMKGAVTAFHATATTWLIVKGMASLLRAVGRPAVEEPAAYQRMLELVCDAALARGRTRSRLLQPMAQPEGFSPDLARALHGRADGLAIQVQLYR